MFKIILSFLLISASALEYRQYSKKSPTFENLKYLGKSDEICFKTNVGFLRKKIFSEKLGQCHLYFYHFFNFDQNFRSMWPPMQFLRTQIKRVALKA